MLGRTALLLSLVVCVACADADADTRYPAWVEAGSRVSIEEGRPVAYGVGAAGGIRNLALARAAADNRARAALARALIEHRGRPTTDKIRATLTGVRIVEHWTDPSDGTVYALARLETRAAAADGAPTRE